MPYIITIQTLLVRLLSFLKLSSLRTRKYVIQSPESRVLSSTQALKYNRVLPPPQPRINHNIHRRRPRFNTIGTPLLRTTSRRKRRTIRHYTMPSFTPGTNRFIPRAPCLLLKPYKSYRETYAEDIAYLLGQGSELITAFGGRPGSLMGELYSGCTCSGSVPLVRFVFKRGRRFYLVCVKNFRQSKHISSVVHYIVEPQNLEGILARLRVDTDYADRRGYGGLKGLQSRLLHQRWWCLN